MTVAGVASRNKKPISEVSLLVSVLNKTEGNRFHYVKTDKNGRFLLNNLSFTDSTTVRIKTASLSKDYAIDFAKDKNTPSVITALGQTIDTKLLFSNAPTDNMKAYLDATKLALEGERSRVERSIELLKDLPRQPLKIAESGIASPQIAAQLLKNGFNGLLIGEYFMKHKNPEQACEDFVTNVKNLLK